MGGVFYSQQGVAPAHRAAPITRLSMAPVAAAHPDSSPDLPLSLLRAASPETLLADIRSLRLPMHFAWGAVAVLCETDDLRQPASACKD